MSFNKQQERIRVPFAALSAFVDPSVRFGLQFDRKDKAAATRPRRRRAAGSPAAGREAPAAGRARGLARTSPRPAPSRPPRPSPRTASKIVKLDSFRKK